MKLIKYIIIILILLICLSIFQCERNGGISNIISDVIVDTQELVDNVKEQVKEKKERK